MKIDISTARQLRDRGLLNNMFDRPDKLMELVRIGSRLHRYYEHVCNGYNCEKYERLSEKLELRAKQVALELGAYIYIQSDPRGATIYILIINQYQRTTTQEQFAWFNSIDVFGYVLAFMDWPMVHNSACGPWLVYKFILRRCL